MTGVNDVATALAVSVFDVIASVVESASDTVRENIFVAVTDAESVTVTV